MDKFIHNKDWSDSPLGPVGKWPQNLQSIVNICLASNVPAFICWGEDFTFICNDEWKDLIAYKQASLLGEPAREIFEENWQVIKSNFREVLSTGEIRKSSNLPLSLPSGEQQYFTFSFNPISDGSGTTRGIFSVAHEDVRHIEKNLLQSERKIADFFENAPIGIHWLGPDGTIQKVNQAELNMLGYSRKEYVGSHIADIHADKATIDDILSKLDNREEILDYEARLRCKDGSIKHVLINSSVYKEDGEFSHTRCFTTDITHRKHVEQELRKNRNRLRTAIEIDTVGVIFWDGDDFTITEVNNAFLEMSGYSREEIIGKSWQELTPEEYYQVTEQRIADLNKSGRTEPFEKQYIQKNGSCSWGLFAPRRIDENEVVEFVIDITDRKETEQEREQLLKQVETEKERLSDIFRQAPSFMCIQRGPDHVYERVNNLYRELVGGQKFIGKPVREVLSDLEGQGYFELLDRVYETGEPYVGTDMKVVLQHPNSEKASEERYLDFVYQPLWGPDGSVNGIFTQGVDLTERKKAKEELKAVNESLEERVKERTKKLCSYQRQLRSLASQLNKAEEQERQRLASELHDRLGQILAVAKMKTDGLQHENLPDQSSKEVEELKNVLDDALTYNQNLMSELKPPPVLDKEDVSEVLYWIVKKVRKQGLDIHIENDEASKPVAKEIRTILHQSVRELLQNVLKHADTNEARVTISAEHGDVKVTVEDNGKGFDVEKNMLAPTEEGRLGLFNIQERMSWHGGSFEIESEPGNGTKAMLYAPLKEKEKQPAEEEIVPPSQKEEVQEELQQKIKVLLADDHEMMRRGLRQMIAKQEDLIVAAEASDGKEAVEQARETSPHVIIMDVNMPKMDGIEATQHIKAEMSNVRVIGLSLHDSSEVIQDMKEAGASDYLTKSEALESLIVTIRAETKYGQKN